MSGPVGRHVHVGGVIAASMRPCASRDRFTKMESRPRRIRSRRGRERIRACRLRRGSQGMVCGGTSEYPEAVTDGTALCPRSRVSWLTSDAATVLLQAGRQRRVPRGNTSVSLLHLDGYSRHGDEFARWYRGCPRDSRPRATNRDLCSRTPRVRHRKPRRGAALSRAAAAQGRRRRAGQ